MKQNGMIVLAGFAIIVAAALTLAVIGYPGNNPNLTENNPPIGSLNDQTYPDKIVYFSNAQEIIDAFNNSQSTSYGGRGGIAMPTSAADSAVGSGKAETAAAPSANGNYSTTNNQVMGVDEADIVKTDGTYIYAFYKNKIVITQAVPATDAHIVATINLDDVHPQEMFISGNHLLVFGNKYTTGGYPSPYMDKMANPSISYYPYWGYSSAMVTEYDISDKSNPSVLKELEFRGNYVTARMIENKVYFVMTTYPDYRVLSGEDKTVSDDDIIPSYYEDGVEKPLANARDIGYIPPVYASQFVTLVSLDLDSREVNKETIVGSAESVYASESAMYLAHTQWNYGYPIPMWERLVDAVAGVETPSAQPDATDGPTGDEAPSTIIAPEPMQDNQTYTIVHKFELNDGEIDYIGKGQVPGHVLNQFSMDEHNGFFRIATTTDAQWDMFGKEQTKETNNVFVLDGEMETVGTLDDLAPGEKIYSARFMGDRAYLVTFKQVDPLFVIDMSEPTNPHVLGKLKIPGYSNYLHPIDETHLIGIGKDAEVGKNDNAYYLGMKLAIFDVSDVENPKLMHSLVVGDRGTDSPALYDHKAFLFDKEKELMVLPIQLNEVTESQKKQINGGSDWMDWPAYGEPVFQGAIAYHVSLEDGIQEIGKVTHIDDEANLKSGYYYDYAYQVQRSLFIGDVLYTVSSKMIKANDLSNELDEIKAIPFAVISKTFTIQDKIQGVFCAEQPCSYQEVLINKSKIKTSSHSGGEDGYVNISEYPPYSQYDDMVELLDWEAFKALDETLGCPGCADGPIETITISDGKGTTKTVKMEAGMQIEGLNEFLQSLRNYVGGGYYYPMMAEDPMPVDIDGGIGSTPPSDGIEE